MTDDTWASVTISGVRSAVAMEVFFAALTLVSGLAQALIYGLGGYMALRGDLDPVRRWDLQVEDHHPRPGQRVCAHQRRQRPQRQVGVVVLGADLVAPHDPQPLLRQIDGLEPGTWTVDYLEEAPEAWTLRLTRAES